MPCRHRVRRRFQTSFRRMDHCIFWRLGFRQSSCSPYRAGPSVRRPIRLDPTTDFLPCCCPQYFLSDQGQALGPRTSLQVPPHCVGDTTGRFVAHHAIFPFHLSDPGSAIRSRDLSSRPCPLRGRYNAAPRGAATTGSGRIVRCSCVRHARKHLSPSRSTAGSDVDRSSAA